MNQAEKTCPFSGPRGERATPAEVSRRIGEILGATVVVGFSRMMAAGPDAVGNVAGGTDRVPVAARMAGFSESGREEWLLHQSARTPMFWQTEPVPADATAFVVFLLNVGFGNGSPLPQPTGTWVFRINGREAIRVRGVNHSQLWRAEPCAMAFSSNRIETAPPFGRLCLSDLIPEESQAAFGPALLRVPTAWVVRGQPTTISVAPVEPIHSGSGERAESKRWFQIGSSVQLTLRANLWPAVELLSGTRRLTRDNHQIFFGDIHTHSGQVGDAGEALGCGMGTQAANYQYARGPGGLDFYALTDHEYQIDPGKIDDYLALADAFNEEGRFVCLPAYEFTSPMYGHRNVYFRSSGGTVFNSSKEWGKYPMDPARCHTPVELWQALEKTGVPCLTVPHHSSSASHPLNLDFYDPRYDRLFEIYSSWGSSEYYGDFPHGVGDRFRGGDFQDACRRGLRYGVIASSDGHDGHPGAAQCPIVKHHHLFHFCGSGLTAVLAPELTRSAVFDALHARRCYGTTGVPIWLDVTVSGAAMGSEIPVLPKGQVPQISLRCVAPNGLDHLRVVKNGMIVATLPCHGQFEADVEWEDKDYNPEVPSSYYIRVVQVDKESAWSSPVWVGD